MSIRVEQSEWRQKRWDWHGKETYKNMRKSFGKNKFQLTDVAELDALDHLAPRTAYDTASAICRELELRKKLKRQGTMMRLRENK